MRAQQCRSWTNESAALCTGVAQVYQLVDQPALALLHHDVLRLEVPVDDAPVVEVAQGGHDVVEDLQHLGLTEAPAGLDVVQQPPGSGGQQCRDQVSGHFRIPRRLFFMASMRNWD